MNLRRTPLFEEHRKLGARLVEFAGWEMPVQYESALQEHLAVRRQAGLFDVSHMGQLQLEGEGALEMAQRVTCNDVNRLGDGQAQYTAFLNPQGGFIDDVVLYRISQREILVCVNAANREKDFQWLREHRRGQVEIRDRSQEFALLALQGPRAAELLRPLTDLPLDEIRYYRFARGKVCGVSALVSRTGYTGEDGFELYLPSEQSPPVWRRLLEEGHACGLKPCGLAARNSLRLEMCYALYGNDIDESTTPWEAGLGWIVKMDKGDFIGRSALEEQKRQGIQRKLVGFQLVDRGVARDGYPVFVEGQAVSQVTSGGYSPCLDKSIGLAYLPIRQAEVGQELQVEVRGKRLRAQVVKTPFYQRPSRS